MTGNETTFGEMPLGEVLSHLYGTLLHLNSGEDGADGPQYVAHQAFAGEFFIADDFDKQHLSLTVAMFLEALPYLYAENENLNTTYPKSASDLARFTLDALRKDVIPMLERQAATGSRPSVPS